MAAEHERALGCTGEGNPMVPGGVVVMLDVKTLKLLLEPRAGAKPDGRPCDALCSVLVRGKRSKLIKMRDN